jgi:cyclase
MSRKLVLSVLGAVLLGATVAIAQRDLSKIQLVDTELAPGIHMLVGAGGNIGVLAGPDGTVLIDDQFAEMSDKLKAAVAKISDRPIRFVLNTHWHGDHTGGNEILANAGVTIVAHDNVPKRMSVDYKNPVFGWEAKASPAAALPVLTFNESATFHLDGQDMVCMHAPNAHTDGDVMVWFPKANVMHMGDCLFTGMYPIIDVGSGGSLQGMIAAQEKALKLIGADTKVIPGHGKLGTRVDVQDAHNLLVQVRARVKQLMDDGKTFDQILAAKPLADLQEKWGKGFVTDTLMLKSAVADLQRR